MEGIAVVNGAIPDENGLEIGVKVFDFHGVYYTRKGWRLREGREG